MPGLTPHVTAQLTIMAGRGVGVEQMASRLGLSPAAVEAELRWLKLTAGKAQEPRAHYAVEAGGWLRRKDRFELAGEAQAEAEGFRRAGGKARVVRVADDGTRRVVE